MRYAPLCACFPVQMRSFSALLVAQIKSLSRKIEDRTRAASKIEKSIKVARVSTLMPIMIQCVDSGVLSYQDNWHPALQDLVSSLGKRFSEAFDRASATSRILHNLS
jgi:hypothetical protein